MGWHITSITEEVLPKACSCMTLANIWPYYDSDQLPNCQRLIVSYGS